MFPRSVVVVMISMMMMMMMIGMGQSFTIPSSSTSVGTHHQQYHPVGGRCHTTSSRLYNEPPQSFERGVSVDQDGKSNVWAIEPKVEIEQKSNEEQSASTFLAIGGLVACGAAAALILTNLPDPNQF